MNTINHLMSHYFGYNRFRPGQKETITHVMHNHHTLAIMPTGNGKSLCFQLPGLAKDGTAIIISPLISLMKDQVDALQTAGIAATYINSSLSTFEQQERMNLLQNGTYKFIYVAPERFQSSFFIRAIEQMNISFVAFDEAHCISQWGHDFRPSYRSIVPLLQELRNIKQYIALTATATKDVKKDIQSLLHIHDEHVVQTGFDRPNLHFHLLKGVDKTNYIRRFIKERQNESGIIYCATRNQVDNLYDRLQKEDISVAKYHAGLTEIERKQGQNDFVHDKVQVMIATNAFGMGIDKSNVRYVLHYAMPMNIESYYQEAGRAGRDGEKSDCILLFSKQDIQLQKFLIEQSEMEENRKQLEYEKLQAMTNYCFTTRCLNDYIIRYFTQETKENFCTTCSNCLKRGEKIDITEEAQMILSCIKRMDERFGVTMTAKVLKGSNDQKIRQFQFQKLSTYGLLKKYTEKEITEMMQYLIAEQYVGTVEGKYPTLQLNEQSVLILKGKKRVEMYELKIPSQEETDFDAALFQELRNLRQTLASEFNVPPYVLFSDATLRDLCRYYPVSKEDMLQIKGVGEKKFAQYGQVFLDIIVEWTKKHPNIKRKIRINHPSSPSFQHSKNKNEEGPSYIQSYKLFQSGKTLDQIAQRRDIQRQTVEEHLFQAYEQGYPINWSIFFNEEEEQIILASYKKLEDKRFKNIKESIPAHYSYSMIKAVLLKHELYP